MCHCLRIAMEIVKISMKIIINLEITELRLLRLTKVVKNITNALPTTSSCLKHRPDNRGLISRCTNPHHQTARNHKHYYNSLPCKICNIIRTLTCNRVLICSNSNSTRMLTFTHNNSNNYNCIKEVVLITIPVVPRIMDTWILISLQTKSQAMIQVFSYQEILTILYNRIFPIWCFPFPSTKMKTTYGTHKSIQYRLFKRRRISSPHKLSSSNKLMHYKLQPTKTRRHSRVSRRENNLLRIIT